jgi:hypothetical protein
MMPACKDKFVILVLMDDERKGMELGEYIEEGRGQCES